VIRRARPVRRRVATDGPDAECQQGRAGRQREGREWLESGISKARSAGNSHAASELEEALNQIPPPPSIG
jgi:hypothetical protein